MPHWYIILQVSTVTFLTITTATSPGMNFTGTKLEKSSIIHFKCETIAMFDGCTVNFLKNDRSEQSIRYDYHKCYYSNAQEQGLCQPDKCFCSCCHTFFWNYTITGNSYVDNTTFECEGKISENQKRFEASIVLQLKNNRLVNFKKSLKEYGSRQPLKKKSLIVKTISTKAPDRKGNKQNEHNTYTLITLVLVVVIIVGSSMYIVFKIRKVKQKNDKASEGADLIVGSGKDNKANDGAELKVEPGKDKANDGAELKVEPEKNDKASEGADLKVGSGKDNKANDGAELKVELGKDKTNDGAELKVEPGKDKTNDGAELKVEPGKDNKANEGAELKVEPDPNEGKAPKRKKHQGNRRKDFPSCFEKDMTVEKEDIPLIIKTNNN